MKKNMLLLITLSMVVSCGQNNDKSSSTQATEKPNNSADQLTLDPLFKPKFETALTELSSVTDFVIQDFEDETFNSPNLGDKIAKIPGHLYVNELRKFRLGNSLKYMKISSVDDARLHIVALTDNIKLLRREIDNLYTTRTGLPEDRAAIIELWFNYQSQQEVDGRIAFLENKIVKIESERDAYFEIAKTNINASLKSNFTTAQTQVLILAPDSDMFIQAVAVFMNYDPFVAEIKHQIQVAKPGNERLAYFQRAFISLIGTLRYAQGEYLLRNEEQQKNIKEVFIGKVNAEIAKDLKRLEIAESSETKKSIEKNIQQRHNLIAIANKYVEFLEKKHQSLFEAREKLLKDNLNEAISTYTLMDLAAILGRNMADGIALYDQIGSLVLPDMSGISLNMDELIALSEMLDKK